MSIMMEHEVAANHLACLSHARIRTLTPGSGLVEVHTARYLDLPAIGSTCCSCCIFTAGNIACGYLGIVLRHRIYHSANRAPAKTVWGSCNVLARVVSK